MLLAFTCKAQSPEQVLKVADELFEQGHYRGSIGFYKQAFQLDSTNGEILYKYGRNLFMIKKFKKASRYLLKAELLGADRTYPMLHFELAQAYHQSAEYRKAKRFYNRAIRPYRRDRKSYWYKRIDQAKDAASWAYKRKNEIPQHTVENLGEETNQSDADFAGVVKGNKLYFTALIADSIIKGNQIADREYFSLLYTKVLNSKELPNALAYESKNRAHFKDKHLANLSIAEDNRVFFSVCDTNKSCEIWQAKLVGKLLMDPVKLSANINKSGSNNTMPHWFSGEAGNYLFFVSDREGGFGDLDIWLAKEESFGYDLPINAGAAVNTMGKEVSPYYSEKDQQLYFSSDWHYGYGGFDVFKAEGFPPSSNKAENLGRAINSNLDDLYFYPYGDSALLSSNRSEGAVAKNNCCNDLYKLHYPRSIRTKNEPSSKDTLVKKVSISTLNQYLPLELYFHNDVPKPSSSDTTTEANYLELAYNYLALEKNYLDQLNDYAKEEQKVDQIGNFFDDELSESIKRLEEITPMLLAELKKGSRITLNVKAYSSQLSKSEYNLKLSSRRIESLINYLKEYRNGIFIPYMKDQAANGGGLQINKLPYGEFAFLSQNEQQDENDGIYSYEAIKQRKINILAVTKSKENVDQNTLEKENLPRIELNSTAYDLKKIKKGQVMSRVFILKNKGQSVLKLYNVVSENPALKITNPNEVKAGDQAKIICEIDTKLLSYGKNELSATLVSNALRNLIELNLKMEVTP